MPMLDDVTAVVLAGGRSSRFGSDKLAVDIEGRSMLQRSVDAVAVVAPRILIVLAPGAERPAISAEHSDIEILHDETPHEGPLAALSVALAAVRTPVALIVGGDMPRMVPAVLQRLASTVGPGHEAVNLDVPGRLQPIPMAVAVEPARAAVRALLEGDERSLRGLLRHLAAVSIPAPAWLSLDPGGVTIKDVDRPADLHS